MTVPFLAAAAPIVGTPFELVSDRHPTRIARKAVALSLCRRLEEQAFNRNDPPIVLATFQNQKFFTPVTAARYSALAGHCPLVAAIGIVIHGDEAPGVRAVPLLHDDPLIGEWSIVVVGSHFALAFTARDLGDDGADCDRRFEFLITHDRDIAVAAGRSLLTRLR